MSDPILSVSEETAVELVEQLNWIQDARTDLEGQEDMLLRRYGFKTVTVSPGAYNAWSIEGPNGERVIVSKSMALSILEAAAAMSYPGPVAE